MTDDLVARLRETSGKYDEYCWHSDIELEAADRIEELEAVLLEISNAVGDPSAYWIACVALEKVK